MIKKTIAFFILLYGIWNAPKAQEYVTNGDFEITNIPAVTNNGYNTLLRALHNNYVPNWELGCRRTQVTPQGSPIYSTIDVYHRNVTDPKHRIPVNRDHFFNQIFNYTSPPALDESDPTDNSFIGFTASNSPIWKETMKTTLSNGGTNGLPKGVYSIAMDLASGAVGTQTNGTGSTIINHSSNWEVVAYIQSSSDGCSTADRIEVFRENVDHYDWVNYEMRFCIPHSKDFVYDELHIEMEYPGSIPGGIQSKYTFINNVSLTRKSDLGTQPANYTYNVNCVGYNSYSVSLSAPAAAAHHWQVYDAQGTELTNISLYGVSDNTPTINLTGNAGDVFRIKHGTFDYDGCFSWLESSHNITIPCYTNLNTSFTINQGCTGNDNFIEVAGGTNPCDTYWQYNLFDSNGDLVEIISYWNNVNGNTGSYNANTFAFNSSLIEPCSKYTIQHGVWNDCIGWTSESKIFTTDDCSNISASFQMQKNGATNGAASTHFLYTDPIYFNGLASNGETQYYIDLWQWSASLNSWQPKGRIGPNANGWRTGTAGIIDIRAAFPNVPMFIGKFKIKLAVANSCNGWVPIEKEFYLLCPICKPAGPIKSNSSETEIGFKTIPTVNIYPNPTHNRLNIKTDNEISSIEIYSSTSQLMTTSTDLSIDVSDFPKGIYTLHITFANKTKSSQTFIKN